MKGIHPVAKPRIGGVCALALLLSHIAPAVLHARPAGEPPQPELGARVVSLLRVDGALLPRSSDHGKVASTVLLRGPTKKILDVALCDL